LADPAVVEDLVHNRQNRKDGPPPAAKKPESAPPHRLASAEAKPATKAKSGGFFSRLFGE
jgi:hypothetical protein